MSGTGSVDRLSICKRPLLPPLMYQSWQKLLFVHWTLQPESLRPFVPSQLQLDTFEGKAWIALTPFIVRNFRLSFLPPLPFLSNYVELNVRTYVHRDGVPGVWFFSLDADSRLAVIAARASFHLPYHDAEMSLREDGNVIHYSSMRRHASAPAPTFRASWKVEGPAVEAAPGSLEFFLVERYCLYAAEGRLLYRSRIFHHPWKLQNAVLLDFYSTMLETQGLPPQAGPPLLHYSHMQDASVWPLKEVSDVV